MIAYIWSLVVSSVLLCAKDSIKSRLLIPQKLNFTIMKLSISILFTFLFSILMVSPSHAVNSPVNQQKEQKEQTSKRSSKKAAKALKKKEKMSKRLSKWMKRISKKVLKWEKKKKKRKDFTGMDSGSQFRIGLILLGGGLLVAILARAAGLSFLNWIAGLAAFVGLVLLILSFLDL